MFYTAAECIYFPWRDELVNIIDAVVCICLSLFCFYSTATIQSFLSLEERRETYGPYALASFSLAMICLFSMTAYAIKYFFTDAEYDKRIPMEATRHMLLLFKAIWETDMLSDQKAWQNKVCNGVVQHLTNEECIQFVALSQTVLREIFLRQYDIKYADPKLFPGRLHLEAPCLEHQSTHAPNVAEEASPTGQKQWPLDSSYKFKKNQDEMPFGEIHMKTGKVWPKESKEATGETPSVGHLVHA